MDQNITPIINYDMCTQCGQCVEICPENSLELTDMGPAFKIPITCTYCALCEDICPEGAIRAPFLIVWDENHQQTSIPFIGGNHE